MSRIARAILSCHDKTGICDLGRVLAEFGVEIISTAGTRTTLEEAGIETVSIADFTGVQEMMDGRVKSLHHKIHAGLLGIRDNKLHFEQLQAYECQWIDLVAVNLHPIEAVIENPTATLEEVIDQIDIGGMAMIRSAAKNFRYVTVVVNPERYPAIIHELRAHDGEIPFATRYQLAQEAFACTADYDRRIAEYLDRATQEEE